MTTQGANGQVPQAHLHANTLRDNIDDDAAILAALGHKEELERQFSFFSLAAYATITSNAWVS
jgi:hypothetical protein